MKSASDGGANSDSEPQVKAPSWISVGKKLHWWSESQQKNMSVKVAKVDDKKHQVYVTFDIDPKAFKSVPFSKIGKKDCPLRNPDANGSRAGKTQESSASKEKKQKDQRDGSVTPNWWDKEEMMKLHEKAVKKDEQLIKLQKKEEEKKKEERRRQELAAAERKKVEEAFEKRKAEAERLKLKEEEEWRQNLLKKRREEDAEQEVKEKEKEERRRKRKEEKEAKDRAAGIVKKPKVAPKAETQATVIPPRALVPEVGLQQAAFNMASAPQWLMGGAPQSAMQSMQALATMQAMREQAAASGVDTSSWGALPQGGGNAWGVGMNGVVATNASSGGFGGAGPETWGAQFGNAGAQWAANWGGVPPEAFGGQAPWGNG